MGRDDRNNEWPLVHGAIVLIVVALFLYSLLPVLSPVILFLALLLVLSPYVGTRLYALTAGMGALLLGLWMLQELGTLLAPFVLAFVLAYILDPLVDLLEGWKLSRPLAIGALALPVLGLLALLLFWGIPALAGQVEVLTRQAPDAVRRIVAWLEGLEASLLDVDLPLVDEDMLLDRLRALTPERITEYLQEKRTEIAQRVWQGVLGVGRGLASALTVLGYLVLTPVLTYYLLRDYDRVIERLGAFVPRPRKTDADRFFGEYDDLLARYLRGQLLAAATVGILTWLGLWIVGFPYAGLVGAVAGVFNVVPYLGLPVSLIPAIIISLLSGNVLISLLKMGVVFAAVQALDGSVIGPKIVGGSVGLHPVWVILALSVGGFFFGFVGLLIAIPAAILIKLLIRHALERYRHSELYRGGGGEVEA